MDNLFICPRCGGQMNPNKTKYECEDCKYAEETWQSSSR